MAKNNEVASTSASSPSLDPQEIIKKVAAQLEIPKGTCTNEHYSFLLFIGLVEAGILPRENLPAAVAFFDRLPKNASAMRQFLEKEDKAPAESKLLAKYLGKSEG
jgi:hypothetical protein